MIRGRVLLSLCAPALLACRPQLDSSGSNPGGDPALADLSASDPALCLEGTSGFVVLAYDDQAGAFDADTTAQKLVPKAHPSRAGISVSQDHGTSWERIGPIAPADASCGDPACAVSLAGAPTLAPTAYGPVLWAGLAYTDPALPQPDAIAYSTSDDAGRTWSAPRVTGNVPGVPPGEPTIDQPGSVAMMMYADRAQGQLQLVLGSSDPIRFDEPPVTPIIVRDDVGVPKAHPIVRAVTGLDAYVAYIQPRDEQGTTFDLRVAELTRPRRGLQLLPWQGLVIFRLNDVHIDPTRPGAQGRAWRDDAPISFAVGAGPKLYLAFRALSSATGASRAYLAACDATWAPNCSVEGSGQNTAGWAVYAVDDLVPSSPFHGGQYRPLVAADPNSGAVALSWMQEVSPGSAQVTLGGTFSTSSDGLVLGNATDLRAGGNGGAWTPCPTAGAIAGETHSYGAHDALLVLPFDANKDTTPAIVGAHVDSSGGCQPLGDLTFDQHVAVSTW